MEPQTIVKKKRDFNKYWFALVVLFLVLSAGYSVYAWRHINSLNDRLASLNQQKTALATKYDQLSATSGQKALSTNGATNQTALDGSNSSKEISNLTINGSRLIPTSTYNPYPQNYSNYFEVDFTITNNTSKEQSYSLSGGDNNKFVGITATGEIISPIAVAPMNVWTGASILAGGSAKGFALFDPSNKIVSLRWYAPDFTKPADYKIDFQ